MKKYQAALRAANSKSLKKIEEDKSDRALSTPPTNDQKVLKTDAELVADDVVVATPTKKRTTRHLMARPMIMPSAPEQAPPSPSTDGSEADTTTEDTSSVSPESNPTSAAVAETKPSKSNSFRAMVELGLDDNEEERKEELANTLGETNGSATDGSAAVSAAR